MLNLWKFWSPFWAVRHIDFFNGVKILFSQEAIRLLKFFSRVSNIGNLHFEKSAWTAHFLVRECHNFKVFGRRKLKWKLQQENGWHCSFNVHGRRIFLNLRRWVQKIDKSSMETKNGLITFLSSLVCVFFCFHQKSLISDNQSATSSQIWEEQEKGLLLKVRIKKKCKIS